MAETDTGRGIGSYVLQAYQLVNDLRTNIECADP